MVSAVGVPGLVMFVGAAPRDAQSAAQLRELAITHWAHHGRKPLAPELVDAMGDVVLLLNPVRDDGEPKPAEWFDASVVFAEKALGAGGRLLITCSRGHHRGPSIAYATLRVVAGMTPSDAASRITSAHPEASLRYAADVERHLHLWDRGVDGESA